MTKRNASPKVEKISFTRWAGLQNGRIAAVYHMRARLTVTGKGDDRRFLMTGPSGEHSLLVSATDADRLNAHWRVFAADGRNAYGDVA